MTNHPTSDECIAKLDTLKKSGALDKCMYLVSDVDRDLLAELKACSKGEITTLRVNRVFETSFERLKKNCESIQSKYAQTQRISICASCLFLSSYFLIVLLCFLQKKTLVFEKQIGRTLLIVIFLPWSLSHASR